MSDLSHVRADGSVQMVDVGGKVATRRIAKAGGIVRITQTHREAIGNLPKGDALTIAQIAGIQGGKRCADLIPLCHSLPIDSIDVEISVEEEGIRILATARTEAKTGVEMEAYTAVVVAGITLIDMLKGVDPDLVLSEVMLLEKQGKEAMEKIVGVITVSDSRSFDQAEDFSGPAVVDAVKHLGFTHFEQRVVPDEIEEIQKAILELCQSCVIVLTTGGTGFSERDVTPEATAPLLEKQANSIVELMRMRTYSSAPYAHLSRSIAGVRGKTLILNLPGSPKAVVDCVSAVGPLFEPITDALLGERCGAHEP